jgi:hypothetical protein
MTTTVIPHCCVGCVEVQPFGGWLSDNRFCCGITGKVQTYTENWVRTTSSCPLFGGNEAQDE